MLRTPPALDLVRPETMVSDVSNSQLPLITNFCSKPHIKYQKVLDRKLINTRINSYNFTSTFYNHKIATCKLDNLGKVTQIKICDTVVNSSGCIYTRDVVTLG